ncbi:OB-fold protein [Tenacibaculum halocynthiae]|uniref:OB-fold protein n=1 Tax=Tenacibaculum halocynthiae TaxID=1254437 RepID=UPI0038930955
MNTVKKIVSVLFLLSGLGGLIRKDFIPAILFILLGVLLYPTISSKIKESFKPWNNKTLRYGAYLLIFIISGSFINSKNNSSTTSTNSFISRINSSKYSDYNQKTLKNVKQLPDRFKQLRENTLSNLESTQTYKTLVTDKVVSIEYLPLLTLLNNGTRAIYKDSKGEEAFTLEEPLVNQVEKSENGSDKMKFVISTIQLATPNKGGIPAEVVEVFDRYKKKYSLFGKPSKVYNSETNQSESIEKAYDMTGVFTLLQPNNETFLNKLYEANNSVSSWFPLKNNQTHSFPFISTLKGYTKHVRKVYPKSSYVLNVDAELTANQLYRAYNENEIAADKKYKSKKLAITGIVSDISEVWGKVSVDLKVGSRYDFTTIKCSINDKNVVAALRKEQRITVIGICDGLTANLYIGLNDCKIWGK